MAYNRVAKYRPAFPYTTPIELLIPIYTKKKGVTVKEFPETGIRLNCSWKTYGGTETVTNDVFTIIDTANIETWYRPDITASCRIKLITTGQLYEIINNPENIDMRNQFVKFKVKAIEGGA